MRIDLNHKTDCWKHLLFGKEQLNAISKSRYVYFHVVTRGSSYGMSNIVRSGPGCLNVRQRYPLDKSLSSG